VVLEDVVMVILLPLDVDIGLTQMIVLSLRVDGKRFGKLLVVTPDLTLCVGKLIELPRLVTT